MKRFAFISRHEPTDSQIALAAAQGIELLPAGDMDAFDVDNWGNGSVLSALLKGFDGAVVVHPLLAMHALACRKPVGVFENVNRAPAGEKPVFEAGSLVVIEPVDDSITGAAMPCAPVRIQT